MKKVLGLEPAFPLTENVIIERNEFGTIACSEKGISKRFYAACAVAPSIINAIMTDKERLTSIDSFAKSGGVSNEEIIINIVYEYADELLRQEQLNTNENETNKF